MVVPSALTLSILSHEISLITTIGRYFSNIVSFNSLSRDQPLWKRGERDWMLFLSILSHEISGKWVTESVWDYVLDLSILSHEIRNLPIIKRIGQPALLSILSHEIRSAKSCGKFCPKFSFNSLSRDQHLERSPRGILILSFQFSLTRSGEVYMWRVRG